MATKSKCDFCDRELPKGLHTCQEYTGKKCLAEKEIEESVRYYEEQDVERYLRRHRYDE